MGLPHQARAVSRYPTFASLLLLLLSSQSIIAQETPTNTFQTVTTTPAVATSVASSAFFPSATPVSSSAISNGSPSPTSDIPLPSATSNPNSTTSGGFNYYFIIIAAAAAAFVLFFILMARRRQARAIAIRSHTQRALSVDTAGYHSPRYGRGWGPPDGSTNPHTISSRVRNMGRRREEVPEGLNEAGEAPPPYMPGSKPPSLRSDDGDLEMGDMRRPVPKQGEQPPDYGHEHTSSSSSLGQVAVSRPETAVTRSETTDVMRSETAAPRPEHP